MEIIGEKLKASREEKGLSLEEVSEDLNIKVEDLNNIELGNKSAFEDIYFLKKYADRNYRRVTPERFVETPL